MSDRRISLLHFFPSFAIGGQQRRLAALIEGLGPEFAHRICSLDGDLGAQALMPDSACTTVEPFVLQKSRLVGAENIGRLRRTIAEADADLLCTYNFGSIEALIANRIGANLPHVHHEDGFGADEAGGKRKKRRALARRLLLSRSLTVVPSLTLEKIAISEWKLDPARVRRIPVGVDLSRFGAMRRDRPEGPVVVGSIGSLRAEKNFARLIRCFEKASEGRAARLVIYGDGAERARLEEIIRSSPARDRILLAGKTEHPEAVLTGLDAFALSSDTEQTPISLIEAMASGLPALATDVGDVRLMMADAGFAVAPDDEKEYAARLRALIDDAGLRRRLGEANRLRASEFDQAAMIDAFRRLYLEAVGAGV